MGPVTKHYGRGMDQDGGRGNDRDGGRSMDRDGGRGMDRDGGRSMDRDGGRGMDRDSGRGGRPSRSPTRDSKELTTRYERPRSPRQREWDPRDPRAGPNRDLYVNRRRSKSPPTARGRGSHGRSRSPGYSGISELETIRDRGVSPPFVDSAFKVITLLEF